MLKQKYLGYHVTNQIYIKFLACIEKGSKVQLIKREVIPVFNSVIVVLGENSPVIITEKLFYSQTCLKKLCWYELVPENIVKI